MRLFWLTLLTLCAFAANSLLNRAALAGQLVDPLSFAAIRVLAGTVALVVLARATGRRLPPLDARRIVPALTLAVYMLGFSLAYVVLDAGTGALILFGGVQLTMFAGALVAREPVPPRRWAGAGLAFAGLVWLLLPGVGAVPEPLAAGLMLAAALGWGIYSLAGRRAADPLAGTAANFLMALPVVLLPLAFVAPQVGAQGIVLAVVSGAVTSGLGYALWYAVLPQLGAGRGAVAQMAVPVIAALGGVIVLGERPTAAVLGASGLVLLGVALATVPGTVKAGRR